MKVQLLHHTPLSIADIAISKCYNKEPYSDLEKQQARINRVANVSKHSSTIEHLVYVFDIDGISRAVLQELARHRIASYTVKSTRYTLKELKDTQAITTAVGSDVTDISNYNKDVIGKFIVLTGNGYVDGCSASALNELQWVLKSGVPNDIAKYCLPEAYKTALVMTINARALQNFLELRSSKHALWEIQLLAKAIYEEIPEEHKFLYSIHEAKFDSHYL